MQISVSVFPFVLFLIISASVQIYLFTCLRGYLQRRVTHAALRRLLVGLSAGFLAVMFFVILWRAYGGLYGEWRYPRLVLGVVTASLIWWIGSIGCALTLLAGAWIHRLLPPFRPAAPVNLARREFLQKGIGMAAAAPFMVSGYGVLLERRTFEVEHFNLFISGARATFSPFTVVQLTDIHVGPFMRAEQLLGYVRAANRLEPDLIALTGDFIAGAEEEVLPCVETLAGLRARYGVFACLGNHDIAAGMAGRLSRLFAEHGIHMLVNDAATVAVEHSRLSILGIDDLGEGEPDLGRALSAIENDPGDVKILLSHRPEIFQPAAQQGIDVVIAGHYHGGQIKLLPQPNALSIARFLTPFAEGVFRLVTDAAHDGEDRTVSSLFVGRGIGISGLPIRINCPPQIAHLTLARSS